MIDARMIMKIMPSKKEVASQLCDTVPNKTKDSHVLIQKLLAKAWVGPNLVATRTQTL